jgi:bidirectional [NiFe] hydrogenase diaphorase subunit
MADETNVTFTINGRPASAASGSSLLEAIRRHGHRVPSLCHHEAVAPYGACRLCLVEVKKGRRTRLTTSCNYPVQADIEVLLDTAAVVKHRRVVLELMLASAPAAAPVRVLAAEYGVRSTPFPIVDAKNACIDCGLCARVCKEVVGQDALGFAGRGTKRTMTTPWGEENPACIGCGACVYVCPTHCVEIVDEDGARVLERWQRRMPLRPCTTCGRPIAPDVQLARFAERIGAAPGRFDKCSECR